MKVLVLFDRKRYDINELIRCIANIVTHTLEENQFFNSFLILNSLTVIGPIVPVGVAVIYAVSG
jgi:hypothetical protein